MAGRRWLERVETELRRRRLPHVYVARLVAELRDHAADLEQENPGMDADREAEPLGSPEQIARTATEEFRRRTFAGRHPWLTFTAGPIATVAAVFVLLTATAGATAFAVGWLTGNSFSADDAPHATPSFGEAAFMHAVSWAVRFVPFAAAAWLFVRIGTRSGTRVGGVAACIIVAATAVGFQSTITPATAQFPATWTIGFGGPPGLVQALQALLPVACAISLLRGEGISAVSDVARMN